MRPLRYKEGGKAGQYCPPKGPKDTAVRNTAPDTGTVQEQIAALTKLQTQMAEMIGVKVDELKNKIVKSIRLCSIWFGVEWGRKFWVTPLLNGAESSCLSKMESNFFERFE